jgi:hypothetical protein
VVASPLPPWTAAKSRRHPPKLDSRPSADSRQQPPPPTTPLPANSLLDFPILDFPLLLLLVILEPDYSIHQPFSLNNRRDTTDYRQTLVGPTSLHLTNPATTAFQPTRLIRLVTRLEKQRPFSPRVPELTTRVKISMVILPALVSMTRPGDIRST